LKLKALVDTLKADFRRHEASFKNPALWAVAVYRLGRFAGELPAGPARAVASRAYGLLSLGVEVSSGIVFDRDAVVGKDFHLIHWGNTKIHAGVVMGDRVGIMHDVTLGTSMEREGLPRIGNDVFIGAGAKILGPVQIGDRAIIAANSLVLTDVPAGATAVGVPARVLNYTGRGGAVPGAKRPPAPAPASNGSAGHPPE
jgi:serine O-acetyltransferase